MKRNIEWNKNKMMNHGKNWFDLSLVDKNEQEIDR